MAPLRRRVHTNKDGKTRSQNKPLSRNAKQTNIDRFLITFVVLEGEVGIGR